MPQTVVEETTEIGKVISPLEQAARSLIITDSDGYKAADSLLKEIMRNEKKVSEVREQHTRPAMDTLAFIRDLFKPAELSIADAKKVIKAKMLAYKLAEDEKIEREKAKLAARVEKGTMRSDTAAGKMEALEESKEIPAVKSSVKVLIKVRVTDLSLVPIEYLVADMAKITTAVLREGLTIPGVEKYEEKSIVGSSK